MSSNNQHMTEWELKNPVKTSLVIDKVEESFVSEADTRKKANHFHCWDKSSWYYGGWGSRVKKCQEQNVLEGLEAEKLSRQAESILLIFTPVIFYNWSLESWLKVESKLSVEKVF